MSQKVKGKTGRTFSPEYCSLLWRHATRAPDQNHVRFIENEGGNIILSDVNSNPDIKPEYITIKHPS